MPVFEQDSQTLLILFAYRESGEQGFDNVESL